MTGETLGGSGSTGDVSQGEAQDVESAKRWKTMAPQDVGRQYPFFGSTSATAAAPLPPVRLCPSPLAHFAETAAQRVRVSDLPSAVSEDEKKRLLGVVLAATLALLVVVGAWNNALRFTSALILLSIAAVSARFVSRVARTWSSTAGQARGEFVHSFTYRSCPVCGRELVGECQCGAPVVRASDACCWDCGLKYRWAVLREEYGKDPVSEWRFGAHHLLELSHGRNVWTMAVSITQVVVDAVVSTDTVNGQMRGEVGAHLAAIGGEQIEKDSVDAVAIRRGTDSEFPRIGDTWATSAGTLRAKWVIHTALVGRELTTADVVCAIGSCLEEAAVHDARTVAIPLLGTGRGVLTLAAATSAFVTAIDAWNSAAPTSTTDLLIVFRDEDEPAHFRNIVDSLTTADTTGSSERAE